MNNAIERLDGSKLSLSVRIVLCAWVMVICMYLGIVYAGAFRGVVDSTIVFVLGIFAIAAFPAMLINLSLVGITLPKVNLSNFRLPLWRICAVVAAACAVFGFFWMK